MKLDEAIRLIYAGRIQKARNGNIFIDGSGESIDIWNGDTQMLSINKATIFDEVSEHKEWNDKELLLIPLLPEWAKWIACDKRGDIWCFEEKPIKAPSEFNPSIGRNREIRGFDFIKLTYEQSPQFIGGLKKLLKGE